MMLRGFCLGGENVKRAGKYGELFLTMLRIGLFTFGGGYAMIALLESELIERKRWLEREEFLNMTAIAESTPGPIAINAATYVGYRVGGVMGALLATLGICLPSFVILYAISLFFDAFLSLEAVAYAFRGIQVCVVYLILSAGLKLWRSLEKNAVNRIVVAAVVLCMGVCSVLAIHVSTVFYILVCGTVGIVLWQLRLMRGEGRS